MRRCCMVGLCMRQEKPRLLQSFSLSGVWPIEPGLPYDWLYCRLPVHKAIGCRRGLNCKLLVLYKTIDRCREVNCTSLEARSKKRTIAWGPNVAGLSAVLAASLERRSMVDLCRRTAVSKADEAP